MPRVTGPLGSLSAKGKLKGGPVYQVRHGVRLARFQKNPSNPHGGNRPLPQQAMRWLNEAWKAAPFGLDFAIQYLTAPLWGLDRQYWIAANIAAAKGGTNATLLPIVKPGFNAPPPATASFSTSSATVIFHATYPASPPGWAPGGLIFIAWKQQLPRGAFVPPMIGGSNSYPATSCSAGTATHGVVWQAAGYIWWTNPKGWTLPSVITSALVTPS